MMKFRLEKMKVTLDQPVRYQLVDGEVVLEMNDQIGKEVILNFTGKIYCVACGVVLQKAYGQGFCFTCFEKAPENSECIIRPELCRGHEGRGRDVIWELENHVQPHVVYLALTSDIKVGITRKSNLFTRWIDQGAWKTIVFAETPNRYTCGLIELALKQNISDKTNWQKMLKNEMDLDLNLLEYKQQLKQSLSSDDIKYVTSDEIIHEIIYPVLHYPEKVSSESFDKTSEIRGKLIGIRGQYLIFEGGKVINIRKFSGYEVEVKIQSVSETSSPQQMSLF